MFERYFTDRVMLECIERTPAAPYLDVFVSALKEGGYSRVTIQRYVRSAAHLSHWQQQRGQVLTDLDDPSIGEFKRHLRRCRCEAFRRVNEHDLRGARIFLRHLHETWVLPIAVDRLMTDATAPALFVKFCDWMRQHRGTRKTTMETYRRTIVDALQALGTDTQHFDATGLRAFALDRASRHGRCQAKVVITALRVFLRYLVATGQCQVGLDAAIPTIAGWRLSALPRHLPTADLGRSGKVVRLCSAKVDQAGYGITRTIGEC